MLSIVNILFGHLGPNGPPPSVLVQCVPSLNADNAEGLLTTFPINRIQVFLNNVLTARMLLHLRQWSKKSVQSSMPSREDYRSTALGEMVFSGSHTLVNTQNSKSFQLNQLRSDGGSATRSGGWGAEKH